MNLREMQKKLKFINNIIKILDISDNSGNIKLENNILTFDYTPQKIVIEIHDGTKFLSIYNYKKIIRSSTRFYGSWDEIKTHIFDYYPDKSVYPHFIINDHEKLDFNKDTYFNISLEQPMTYRYELYRKLLTEFKNNNLIFGVKIFIHI